MDEALKVLDSAIQELTKSLAQDSFNGQPAPEGVQSASSGVPGPGDLTQDTFTPPTAAGPDLNAKGGGGLTGGVVGS